MAFRRSVEKQFFHFKTSPFSELHFVEKPMNSHMPKCRIGSSYKLGGTCTFFFSYITNSIFVVDYDHYAVLRTYERIQVNVLTKDS